MHLNCHLDTLAHAQASPKFRAFCGRVDLTRVPAHYVAEAQVFFNTWGFRDRDFVNLFHGKLSPSTLAAVRALGFDKALVDANVASVTEADAKAMMFAVLPRVRRSGGIPEWSRQWLIARGLPAKALAQELGVGENRIRSWTSRVRSVGDLIRS